MNQDPHTSTRDHRGVRLPEHLLETYGENGNLSCCVVKTDFRSRGNGYRFRCEAREIVRNTFKLERYDPKPTADWDAAYARFCKVISN